MAGKKTKTTSTKTGTPRAAVARSVKAGKKAPKTAAPKKAKAASKKAPVAAAGSKAPKATSKKTTSKTTKATKKSAATAPRAQAARKPSAKSKAAGAAGKKKATPARDLAASKSPASVNKKPRPSKAAPPPPDTAAGSSGKETLAMGKSLAGRAARGARSTGSPQADKGRRPVARARTLGAEPKSQAPRLGRATRNRDPAVLSQPPTAPVPSEPASLRPQGGPTPGHRGPGEVHTLAARAKKVPPSGKQAALAAKAQTRALLDALLDPNRHEAANTEPTKTAPSRRVKPSNKTPKDNGEPPST